MVDPTIAEDHDGAQVSPGSRTLGWLGAVALLLVVLALFMHVFAPPIASDARSPESHPQSGCIACHVVTGPAQEAEAQ
ncbi:MAG: hypothetical protein WBJ62_01885 [Coriobacteriia bacterium]|jgi:hypothetical protein